MLKIVIIMPEIMPQIYLLCSNYTHYFWKEHLDTVCVTLLIYNLKAFFFFFFSQLTFLNFGRPFAVTACTHRLVTWAYIRGGLQPPQPPPLSLEPLYNGHHWEPSFCPLQRGVPNSGASGIFPVGVVCVIGTMWLRFRAFRCCTLAGKAKRRLVIQVQQLI